MSQRFAGLPSDVCRWVPKPTSQFAVGVLSRTAPLASQSPWTYLQCGAQRDCLLEATPDEADADRKPVVGRTTRHRDGRLSREVEQVGPVSLPRVPQPIPFAVAMPEPPGVRETSQGLCAYP